MKLWVDVEDIFDYALHVRRPSGIQRVAFELQRALREIAPDSVQFIRHGKLSGSFVTVPFTRLEALLEALCTRPPAGALAEAPAAEPATSPAGAPAQTATSVLTLPPLPPLSPYRRLRRQSFNALPPLLRAPAARLWFSIAEAAEAALALLRVACRPATWRGPEAGRERKPEAVSARDGPRPAERDPPPSFAQGDWFLILGSPWSRPDYAACIAKLRAQHGLRVALLVYDIIPLRRPEWVDYGLRRAFHDWFHAMLPLADRVMAISRASAADVALYCAQTGLPLRAPVRAIALGTGFAKPAPALRSARLPPARSFALVVATIEARKNHMLLFRTWRTLAEQMPMERIPQLVFAGRVGWLVQDLMQQLRNTDWLNGKIMLIDSPSDAELAALYEDCLFTVYPSFYEGWGLPVSESLAYGAPCISSDRTSLPEAGGDLALYFDPDSLPDAAAKIRGVIEDPPGLQAWRERIAREFRPRRWTDAARAIIDGLQGPGETQAPPQMGAVIAAD